MADVYSVRDYGATGLGVVDDRTAIVATMAAAKASGVNHVYFPPGTYLVSQQVTDVRCGIDFLGYSGMTWSGAGPTSIVKMLVTDSFATAWRGLIRLQGTDITIRDLQLNGAWDGTTGKEEQIHLLELASPGTARGVVANNPDGTGFTITLATIGNATNFAIGNQVNFYASAVAPASGLQAPIDYPITQATGTLSLTGNAVHNETVTLGTETYRWRTTLSGGTSATCTISGTAPTMTLTDTNAPFESAMVGQKLYLSQPPNGANAGSVTIESYVGPTQITFRLNDSVAGPMNGVWRIVNQVLIGASATASLVNFASAIAATTADADILYSLGTDFNQRATATASGATLTASALDRWCDNDLPFSACPTSDTMANGSWTSTQLRGGPYTLTNVNTGTGVLTFSTQISALIETGMHLGFADKDTVRVRVQNVDFRDSAGDGLRFQGEGLYRVSDVLVTNCTMRNCKRTAVNYQRNVEHITVTNCYMENTTDACIEFETSRAGNAYAPRWITFDNCIVKRGGGHGVAHLIQMAGLLDERLATGITINNCILRDGGVSIFRCRDVVLNNVQIYGRDDQQATVSPLEILQCESVWVGGGTRVVNPNNRDGTNAARQAVTIAPNLSVGCTKIVFDGVRIDHYVPVVIVALEAASDTTFANCVLNYYGSTTGITACINARATVASGVMDHLKIVNNTFHGSLGGGSFRQAVQFMATAASSAIKNTYVGGNSGEGFGFGVRYNINGGTFTAIPELGQNGWAPTTAAYQISSSAVTHIAIGGSGGSARQVTGTGSPNGVITAPIGSVFLRTDGVAGTGGAPGTLRYINTNSGTTWVGLIDG